MEKGQISIEYLIVMGFVSFVVVVILGVALFYASNIGDKIRENQLNSFAEKIIFSAESVYFSGEPSQVTITAYLPDGVESIEVIDNSLVFNFTTSGGISRIAFSSDVPLDSSSNINPSGGGKRIVVSAQASSNGVYINEEQ